ncbi:helix-turn-helix domain-containing protein [Streptomyces dysideae]|uniref:DNA-binding protein n=1 Tax=Streptomyces dysideae TaxID=909626 RepID=A0A117RY93_9ACTN|nr:helix-turn-helix transcriptional regulator [Streptomyces dysideae]KUO16040.1 DNA-binding protein [Streptomyces dysideae]
MGCLGCRPGTGRTRGETVSAPQDEVHEFAALLTRLKERTDRSYGQLARRLNMNTSTLHRYCAGDAVPLDYAPVERFAALCGATAEERLELHRLWLLAVAARQRPRTPTPTPTPSTPDDTGDGSPTPSPHPEEDPHRPWFRRRLLVTAAVATALLATLGSLAALPADRPSGDVTAEDAPSTRTTAPGSSSHRPPGTTSPSPSPTTGSPSTAKPSDKTTPKPTGKGGVPSGPAQGKKESAPVVPLTWTVNSQVWNQGCGHDYVIDKPPAQVPPPPTAQDAGTWAAAQDALHGRDTNVQISVQGRSSTAVVLEALRVRVVTRGAPVQGSSYSMDQGCGGALTPRFFSVNLDADRPVAHSEAGGDAEGPIPAIQMPYRVSAEDPEILLVTARTETCDCAWYLELDWSSQGRTGTVRIDDHGRPFRTTSIKGLPRYTYDTSARQWVPYS